MARYVVRIARRAGLIILFLIAAVLGTVTGVVFAFAGDLPQISALDDYAPSTITRVYGARGDVVGEFAIQRRVLIKYQDISPTLRNAVLAAEDDTFFQHFGLSIPHIVLAAVKDLMERRKAAGASTLTQQLTRKLFLKDEKWWSRKIKEAILAIQIEKRYTKEEIFTMYCNQMYFGHGAYGVEAAAHLYFGKSAKDLTLEEAALIAGILQGNVRQSPYVNMDAALRRRNYTLDRMAEVGSITRQQADEAKKKPVVTRGDPATQSATIAPYFLEEVRKELEGRYGAKQLYENGLTIQTALDLRLQEVSNRALETGSAANRPSARLPQAAPQHPRRAPHDRGVQASAVGSPVRRQRRRAGRRRGRRCHAHPPARRRPAGSRSTRKAMPGPARRFQRSSSRAGDLVETKLLTIDPAEHTATGSLDQPPAVEGAVLAIDNRTGQIKVMVGGYSFDRSKFNRADAGVPAGRIGVQAVRLHRRDRPRLYADDDPRGHAGHVSRRRRLAAVLAAELRQASSRDRSRSAMRSKNRATYRRFASWINWAPSRSSPMRGASGSRHRCRRTSRSRSAPPKRRCSR